MSNTHQGKKIMTTSVKALATVVAFTLAGMANAQATPVGVAQGLDADERVLVHAKGMAAEDAFMVLGALTVKGRLMRDSELGHEGYRPDLSEDPMQSVGQTWLELLDTVHGRLVDDGRIRAHAGGDDEAAPAVYADAAYLYHMHHSAGRFEHLGLYDELTHTPSPLISILTSHVVNERHADGVMHAANGSEADGFAYGLDALHAATYAWVRQDKPGGAEDMGKMERAALEGWLGHSREDLVEVARAMAEAAEAAWDAEAGIYQLDQGAEWSLDQIGAMLRGHKALYEMLYLYGDSADAERAATLADRAAAIAGAVMAGHGPMRDWGLPARLKFEDGNARAAADYVDTAAQWRFVHQLTGGFSLLREREGTAGLIGERTPELEGQVGRAIDRLLLGALDYQLEDGTIPAALSYADGRVIDPRVTTRSVAAFVQAVGNGYRIGEAFDRPGAWEEGSPLAERSRALYDAFLGHGELLTERLILRE
ncbi:MULTISPECIES: hypothetical protein [unclassified Thioalkalivibrio]|uniref:hypothetical protein n=1 Tax=unclassified Thioalkalivibrio TaxID=2621013 RepID=UPI00035D76D3|nr:MULTISPECIES: hypothetical protein [unclassified Thioalkalivibrio]